MIINNAFFFHFPQTVFAKARRIVAKVKKDAIRFIFLCDFPQHGADFLGERAVGTNRIVMRGMIRCMQCPIGVETVDFHANRSIGINRDLHTDFTADFDHASQQVELQTGVHHTGFGREIGKALITAEREHDGINFASSEIGFDFIKVEILSDIGITRHSVKIKQ